MSKGSWIKVATVGLIVSAVTGIFGYGLGVGFWDTFEGKYKVKYKQQ